MVNRRQWFASLFAAPVAIAIAQKDAMVFKAPTSMRGSHCIAEYARYLNQLMPDDLRQELLLPLVPRLAGTTDTAEQARAEYIALETTRRILGEVCGDCGRSDLAAKCREATTLQECDDAADMVATTFGWWHERSAPRVEVQDRRTCGFAGRTAQEAQQTVFDAAWRHGPKVVAASAAWTVRSAVASRRRAYGTERAAIERKFFVMATEILNGAMAL
jgi:hypothetical protein